MMDMTYKMRIFQVAGFVIGVLYSIFFSLFLTNHTNFPLILAYILAVISGILLIFFSFYVINKRKRANYLLLLSILMLFGCSIILFLPNSTFYSPTDSLIANLLTGLMVGFLIASPQIVITIALFIFGNPLPSTDEAQPPSSFTPKPLTSKQLPPDLSDKYTESEFIGKGGFARVFKTKRKDGIFVALKIPISLDESTGKSFIAELQNWTRLDHPNIVKVYNFNIMPSPYFEMELCDSSLAEKEKPIENEEAAWILFNVCEGLKFTHAQKIIHRDLKPHNILLKNGVPKISDWGLSRVITESTSTTTASFTPYYAAPEQISSNQKDERTDIWQLGVIFYELVTGKLPFTGDSIVTIMAGIATKNPIMPSVITPTSQDVESIIMKCLEKNPVRRYQSVLELQKDLALYLRLTYTESLKTSVSVQDYTRSAYYCGDLVMINLLTGDMKSAYKYLLDLVHYSKGDVKVEAQELSKQLKSRIDRGFDEIPPELIDDANNLVHKVRLGSGKRG